MSKRKGHSLSTIKKEMEALFKLLLEIFLELSSAMFID
jgi:hypothetical protein